MGIDTSPGIPIIPPKDETLWRFDIMRTTRLRVLTLAFISFFFLASLPLVASDLSRRRAAARRRIEGSRASQKRVSRRALNAPVRKSAPRSRIPRSNYDKDSFGKRAMRSVFKLDARGGGVSSAIGQHIGRRGGGSALDKRRRAQSWKNGVGYTINAARAARYLGHALGR